ncbi:MAG TPA: MFS transporter, partial [Burkholderiaceae bacterium]|nr:MFS transporter [Burkholderiaceae bacterium]
MRAPLRSMLSRWLLPPGTDPAAAPLLLARALRALGDGFVAVLLPAYLLALGLGTLEVGILSTATLLGSAAATLAVGAWGHRAGSGTLLRAAALLMAATGLGFAALSSFAPLLVVAVVGTLNPSSGDVSVFLPLEHARLAGAAQGRARTALFARYSVLGALCAALGALAAGVPDAIAHAAGIARLDALRGMFVVYALIGIAVFALYRRLPAGAAHEAVAPAPLGPSRGVVVRLAALFSVDAFAGGLVVNSLLSLWLFERFGLSLAQAGAYFFWAGLLSAASQLAAPRVAARIGLLNTMVFTHLPANVCLVLAALAPSLPLALALL